MKRRYYVLAMVLLACILNVVPYSLSWNQSGGLSLGPIINGPEIKDGTDHPGGGIALPCGALVGMSASDDLNGWPFQTYAPVEWCSPWKLYVGSIIANTVIAVGTVGLLWGIMKIVRRRKQ